MDTIDMSVVNSCVSGIGRGEMAGEMKAEGGNPQTFEGTRVLQQPTNQVNEATFRDVT